MLDRDEDMLTSGWRHPFLGRYILKTRWGSHIGSRPSPMEVHH